MPISRRAAVTISLSWVFMIVIGSFFIILAYNIIGAYQETEEEKFNLEVQFTLRSILNNVGRTAGIEENAFKPIGEIFEDSKVELKCESGEFPILSLDGRLIANNDYLQNYPTVMTGITERTVSSTYLAVESFRLPFRVTNMLAMVSKSNIIYLDSNSEISSSILKKFRESSYRSVSFFAEDFSSLNTDMVNNELEDRNVDSVMFVSDAGKTPSVDLDQLPSDKSYFLEVHYDSNGETGEVQYTYPDGSKSDPFPFIDHEDSNQDQSHSMVIMALFASPESYSCAHRQLVNAIEPSVQFYINKSLRLANLSENRRTCSSSLITTDAATGDFAGGQQAQIYGEMADSLKELKDEFQDYTTSFNNPDNLVGVIDQVEEKRRQLERFSCLYVY